MTIWADPVRHSTASCRLTILAAGRPTDDPVRNSTNVDEMLQDFVCVTPARMTGIIAKTLINDLGRTIVTAGKAVNAVLGPSFSSLRKHFFS